MTIEAPQEQGRPTETFKGFAVIALVRGNTINTMNGPGWEPTIGVRTRDECSVVTHSDRGEKGGVAVVWKGNPQVDFT